MFCFPRFQSINPQYRIAWLRLTFDQSREGWRIWRSVGGHHAHLPAERRGSPVGSSIHQASRVLPQPLQVHCVLSVYNFEVPFQSIWQLRLGFRLYTQVPLAQIWGQNKRQRLKIGTTFKDVIHHRRIITSLFPVVKIATLDQQVGILYLKSRLSYSCKNDRKSGTSTMWMDLLVIMLMK